MSQVLPPRPVSALERAVDATFRKGLDKVSYNENTLELTRVKAHVLFSILSPAKFKYTHILTSDEQVIVNTIPPPRDYLDHQNNNDYDKGMTVKHHSVIHSSMLFTLPGPVLFDSFFNAIHSAWTHLIFEIRGEGSLSAARK